MSRYTERICYGTRTAGDGGLYEIALEHYHEDLNELNLLLAVMAQASVDLHSKCSSAEEKKDALDYFNSNNFLYHCMLMGFTDENSVRKLFVMRPGKERRHVV